MDLPYYPRNFSSRYNHLILKYDFFQLHSELAMVYGVLLELRLFMSVIAANSRAPHQLSNRFSRSARKTPSNRISKKFTPNFAPAPPTAHNSYSGQSSISDRLALGALHSGSKTRTPRKCGRARKVWPTLCLMLSSRQPRAAPR